MRRRILVLLLTFLVLVSMVGCIKPEESPIYTEFDDDPVELTMSVYLWKDNHLRAAARLYEEKTGIKVNIQNNGNHDPEDWDTTKFWLDPYQDTDLYSEQVINSLMTGSGSDIYDLTWVDFEQLGKNGLLVDMGNWLENDSELTDDIVFRDILLSGKTEYGVFTTPIDFYFRKLFATSFATSANVPLLTNERMTWQEFFDESSGFDLTDGRLYADFELNIFMERFVARVSDFVDEFENTQNLYSEEMISLLEECRDWRDMGLCADSRNHPAIDDPCLYSSTFINDYKIAEMLCTLPNDYETYLTIVAPMIFDGDPAYTGGYALYPEMETYKGEGQYGVNAGSPNAEAAQDFLRFLLSDEGQIKLIEKVEFDINTFRLPINRAAFRSLVDRDLVRIEGSYVDNELDIPTRMTELDFPALINEAEEHVNQIAYIILEKPYYRSIIRAVARDFFLDEITAEEAARQMSDKVGLYLKELG